VKVPALRSLLLLAALLAAARGARADALDTRAARLTERFAAGWLERHPEEATRLGNHLADEKLPAWSGASRASDAAWYSALRDSLAALPLDRLTAARAIDVRRAIAVASREMRAVDDHLAERDPGAALRRLDVAIEVPTRSFYASSCSRAANLRRRLTRVPEFLRDAQLALTAPSRVATEAAIERAEELLDLCQVALPRYLGFCHESRVQADLAEADSLASAAIEDYGSWLRENVLPRTVDDLPFGREALAQRLAEVAGAPVALDSLLAAARAEWSSLADFERPAQVAGGRQLATDSVATLFERVRATVTRSREFSLRASDRVEFSELAPPPGEGALIALGPWETRKTRARIDLGVEPNARRRAPTSQDDAVVLLAAEGVPGRALLLLRSPEQPSRVRQTLGVRAVADGWARYSAWLWVTRIAPDSAQVDRVRADEREQLARSVAELWLRVESPPLDSVATWLAAAAPLEAREARRAALEAATDPGAMASTIAFWNLRRLREEAERAQGGFDAARFHDALIREGEVPAAWTHAGARAAAAASPVRRRKS